MCKEMRDNCMEKDWGMELRGDEQESWLYETISNFSACLGMTTSS